MTTTIPDVSTDLSLIEELDFDPEFDCEHSNHGKVYWHTGPAAYFIGPKNPCPGCGRPMSRQVMLCASAWEHWGTVGVACAGCNTTNERDHLVRLVGRVG